MCCQFERAVDLWLQERKAKEKTLDKKRKERSQDTKEVGKQFIGKLRQESDYQGEDYEVFTSWLGQTV